MSSDDVKKEVTGIVLFFCALALTLMYYLPADVTGFVGSWLRNLGFGLIGSAAILIPVYLLYASIDFFIEKREGVSPIRVRSVVFLVIAVAALFAVCTMDFEYFKNLCIDDTASKFKATAAISLLWKSGPDSSIIQNLASQTMVVPGGLLGGGIACALFMTLGKTVSILALIAFLLAQIFFVFSISLKKTVKKAVTNTTRIISQQRKNPYRQQSQHVQYSKPVDYSRVNNGTANSVSRYVNLPAQNTVNSNVIGPVRDPFSKATMPVDKKTGFTDVSAKEFGVSNTGDPNHINYENRSVAVNYSESDASADYEFTAKARTPRIRASKPNVMYSFDKNSKKDQPSDFFDLSGAVYPKQTSDNGKLFSDIESEPIDATYPAYASESYENNSYVDNSSNYNEEDLPQEIIDDGSYQEVTSNEYDSVVTEKSEDIVVHEEDNVPETTSVSNVVTENVNSSSYDPLEGRTVETNEANHAASTDFSNNQTSNIPSKKIKRITRYTPPSLSLLAPETAQKMNKNDASIKAKGDQLVETLRSFGIDTEVVNTTFGPAITRYELKFKNAGVKVSRVLSLENDIALAMAAISVRIEAPIPGTSLIGIEIPNEKTSAVQLSGLIKTSEFRSAKPLEVPLGKNISGKPIMCDLAKMPHLLIAGSTGSGKSVCINTILASILYHSSPNNVRMILVDPKVVELSIYNGIPHLLMPVVTDPKKAISALRWATLEMDRRYKLFAENNVRNLDGYNDLLKYKGEQPLPLILIVVDELADLMTLAKNEVEEQISRLAAMARAAGLHLILATQRPSVDVISGVIKANVPSRIAFAVSSGTDSRTILDSNGAEKLLGKGDMLYAPSSAPKAVRGQGAFLSDKEVDSIVQDLRKRYGDMYDDAIIKIVESQTVNNSGSSGMGASEASAGAGPDDELLDLAVDIVIEAKNASVSILQRRLGIGYPRAARLIDTLEQKHVIGPFEGSKPRKVLITKTDWLEMKSKG